MSYTSRHLGSDKYKYSVTPHFDNYGYDSNIRDVLGAQLIPQRVFPGLQEAGNEAGANGPLYAVNAAGAPILEINRRYTGRGALMQYSR